MLPSLALKSQVRLDDELDPLALAPLSEFIKLLAGEACSKMRDGHLVTIYRVVVVCASVAFSDPVANKLVTIETVVLPFSGGTALCHAEDTSVEFLGCGKIVYRDSKVEWVNRVGIIFSTARFLALLLHFCLLFSDFL